MVTKEKLAAQLTIANKALFIRKGKEKRTAESNISSLVDILELKKEEEYNRHLAAIVEFSDDAIISKTLDGIIKSWNKGGEKMFGYTAKEIIGKHISLIIPEEYINEEKEILKKIRNNEIIDHYETVRVKKSGEQLHVALTVSPLKDIEGNIIGVSKIVRDISFRKKTEEERKKNDEYNRHLAAIVEYSDDAIISKSLDGIIRSWNKGGERMFGYTAKEIIGKHISLIIPPDYINEDKEILKKIRNNEIIDHYETVRVKKSGEQFYVSLTVSPLKGIEGNIIGVSKTARDITIRKKFELDLKNANKKLLFQNEEKEKRASELINANNELAFQNNQKEKRETDLIFVNRELFFQSEEKEKRASELITANKELAFQNQEKENRAAELITANKELAFQNQEKENRAAELVITNKELKKAEDDIRKLNEELEQKVIERTSQWEVANKELESFSYSVSHDLRAPLRAISGNAKILDEDYVAGFDSEGIRALNSIKHNSKRMGNLIDDLLAFSRLGRQQVAATELNMNALVNSIKEEILLEDTENRTEINVNVLPFAKGDQSLIKQVWINLISNAMKYSKYKPKSIIDIGFYINDNLVVYYVKENGVGFDMQYYDKLFGVFQRLHSSEEFEGTGIGLAIIQKIVLRHKGTVWAESKLNEETCFYFSLPNINS